MWINSFGFKFIRTDNTTFLNVNDWKQSFSNSFSELLNAVGFEEKYLHMSRSLYRHVILYENAWKRKKYLSFEIIQIHIYPSNFNKALVIQLNQLEHNFLGN